jgi:hypothetical protein
LNLKQHRRTSLRLAKYTAPAEPAFSIRKIINKKNNLDAFCVTANQKIKRRIYASNQGMIDPVKIDTRERLLIKE